MSKRLVVTGTDTGVGKTVFSAALADALGACYWKPIQSGLDGETDSETAARLGRLAPEQILPEAWRLTTPASPHLSARIDGVAIDPETLAPPETSLPLVIEGAGGLLVPLTRRRTFADVFARWRHPVILCARTEPWNHQPHATVTGGHAAAANPRPRHRLHWRRAARYDADHHRNGRHAGPWSPAAPRPIDAGGTAPCLP